MFHVEPYLQARDYLRAGLDGLGLDYTALDLDRIMAYFERLLTANAALNLISPKQDLRTRVAVHLVDSLSPLLWTDWPARLNGLDLGSGGGLPAIPLAIARPGWELTLAEATGKKTLFLESVQSGLGLDNIQVLNKFLEPDKNPENLRLDLVSARAVSDLKKLAAIAGPRLRPGGLLLAFKGPQVDQELPEAAAKLKKWRLRLLDRKDFRLPLVEAGRSLLRFIKE